MAKSYPGMMMNGMMPKARRAKKAGAPKDTRLRLGKVGRNNRSLAGKRYKPRMPGVGKKSVG